MGEWNGPGWDISYKSVPKTKKSNDICNSLLRNEIHKFKCLATMDCSHSLKEQVFLLQLSSQRSGQVGVWRSAFSP